MTTGIGKYGIEYDLKFATQIVAGHWSKVKVGTDSTADTDDLEDLIAPCTGSGMTIQEGTPTFEDPDIVVLTATFTNNTAAAIVLYEAAVFDDSGTIMFFRKRLLSSKSVPVGQTATIVMKWKGAT